MIWFVMVAVQNLFWGIVAVFAGGMADSFIFALGSSTCSRLVKGISESKVPGTVFPLSAKRQETFRKNLTSWVMKRYNPP